MSCASVALSSPVSDLRFGGSTRMRRSTSEPQLRHCSQVVAKASVMKRNGSIGLFPFNLSALWMEPDRALLEEEREEGERVDRGDIDHTRANWVERLLELRSRWRPARQKEGDDQEQKADGDADGHCGVWYDDNDEETGETETEEEWDENKFGRLLTKVKWSETKLFSKLAFLCNMAYVISEIEAEDLRKYYDLRLVTSSLEKKAEAAIKAQIDSKSTQTSSDPDPDPKPKPGPAPVPVRSHAKRPIRSSAAYEIAASAASYVHSRAKGLFSLGGGGPRGDDDRLAEEARVYKSEVAAFVAASTMTAVVAAEEEARLEAARDLRSLHSSPCEWFVCDDSTTFTRCFVIQGSDSLASWQANLLFEPTKFEETEVLVHRGIYEAAKGIYDQFMPEILSHLKTYGEKAKFRFTGHSLGGSLSLLVNLMLLARDAVPRSSLLPVVTFGSPSVFCSGYRVLNEVGVDEGHICSVMMHRDIVPRAFSCSYPNHIAQLLKRLNGAFRSHPCLNSEKLLYAPLGKLFILQPGENSSPHHPLLPPGAALYSLNSKDANGTPNPGATSALKAFLNNPHPLETLSKPTAYGSDGAILRDHDSSNYLKAINGLIREHTKSFVRRSRRQRLNFWWPRLTGTSLEKPRMLHKEVTTGV